MIDLFTIIPKMRKHVLVTVGTPHTEDSESAAHRPQSDPCAPTNVFGVSHRCYEELGVGEFVSKYFDNSKVYLDEAHGFYTALGVRGMKVYGCTHCHL